MKRALGLAGLALVAAYAALAGCVSVGEGEGEVKSGRLYALDCWDDSYDLKPDFFAADPFRNNMHIRVQRGSDLLEVSDGVSILVDDVEAVRQSLGTPVPVTLQPGIAPPGVVVGTLCPEGGCSAPVHMALYLLESCHTQNTVLYAISGTVTFTELFSGDPNEKDAAEKLSKGSFDVMVADPRDFDSATGEIPNQSNITGNFEFFFQRGQPAQPFP